MRNDQTVAVGLFTQRDLDALGSRLTRVYHLEADDNRFDDLLTQLDLVEYEPVMPLAQG